MVRLFEFEDQYWLPSTLRDGLRKFLAVSHRVFRTPDLWTEKLATIIASTGEHRIVDFCSGAGGPLPRMLQILAERHGMEATATLTDLRPVADAVRSCNSQHDIRYLPEPVDVTSPPQHLQGIRTLICGLHHLPPAEAFGVIRSAFLNRQPILILEMNKHCLGGFLSSCTIPIAVAAFMPFVRPFTWKEVLLTYIIPLLPFVTAWDGFVSHWRTYSIAELRRWTNELHADDYVWDIGETKRPWLSFGLPYLIGMPQ